MGTATQTGDHGERGKAAGGRPRDSGLDAAILAAAQKRLREHGYAGMSLEAVAAEAGTSVPSVRRRYSGRPALGAAVIDTWRVEPLPLADGAPRERALAVLENFRRNLGRNRSMALLGSLLVEERRHPELLQRFRTRLAQPRRTMLAQAIEDAIASGELSRDTDVDGLVNMLIGSFYARYVGSGAIPRDWAARVLGEVWPSQK
jgi:AcrR family transcriptional regulator